MTATRSGITLAQAKQLVEWLEQGEQQQADTLFAELAEAHHSKLFDSVGRLTRDLHDSLQEFQFDPSLEALMDEELPDARNRLNFVIQRTEDAANRTMDAVEASLPLAEQLHQQVNAIQPIWDRLMSRDIGVDEFKSLCHDITTFLRETGQSTAHLQGLMTEVLMAQDYQDITGQVIRRVIELVQDVETNLIELLKVFGKREESKKPADSKEAAAKADVEIAGPEGPIINPEQRDDVVSGQDEVDDLLSSLGF